ncbi:MAG: aspartyl protease family protein [Thermofilum sp.]|nr:aspartyl protease family protein [Thermofilum sp.]
MGEVRIRVRFRALPTSPASSELDLLVDTGAAYSWLPRKLLEELGVKPVRKGRFKTIKGEVVVRDVGYAFVEYEGEMAPTVVVFAEEGDESVLGLHALESLGLEVDPVTRQVKRSEALIALRAPLTR